MHDSFMHKKYSNNKMKKKVSIHLSINVTVQQSSFCKNTLLSIMYAINKF